MANDEETKKRLDAIQKQIDWLAKQVTHVVNSEDRLRAATAASEHAVKEYVTELLTNLRQDMSDSVVSVYTFLFKIDDKREAGQRESRLLRYAVLIGIVIIIGILLTR